MRRQYREVHDTYRRVNIRTSRWERGRGRDSFYLIAACFHEMNQTYFNAKVDSTRYRDSSPSPTSCSRRKCEYHVLKIEILIIAWLILSNSLDDAEIWVLQLPFEAHLRSTLARRVPTYKHNKHSRVRSAGSKDIGPPCIRCKTDAYCEKNGVACNKPKPFPLVPDLVKIQHHAEEKDSRHYGIN